VPFGGLLTVAIIGAAGATAGGALANRSSGSQNPTLPADAQSLQDLITQIYRQRLQQGLPAGYQQQGIAGINSAYAGAATNENAALTARGLASSPVAGAVTSKLNTARAGDIGTFNANLPLVQQNLQLENLQGAEGALTGQRGSTGSTASGGGAAGAFTNLGGYLGYLAGKGSFSRNPNSYIPDPGIGYGGVPNSIAGY
jgi:hypothetical protein